MKREVAYKELSETRRLGIQPFEESWGSRWDAFVWGSNNGTLFHTREFLGYHPPERFQDASAVFTKDDRWRVLLPAAVQERGGGRVLISHPGASFAGPIFDSDLSLKDTYRFARALLEYAYDLEVAQVRMTLPPQIYLWRPSNYLEFALLDCGFTYERREVSSVIPLDFAEEDTLMIFSSEAARAVRKAMRSGVDVVESDDFKAFYAILQRNLKLRHNVQPTHSLEELERLHRMFPDRVRLFAATLDDEMIAGIVVFVCNARVALAFYVSHDESKQEYRGVNYLFFHVVRWAIRQDLKFLDFGIFTVNMKPNWGLARFKEGFGAQGIFRDTLVKEL